MIILNTEYQKISHSISIPIIRPSDIRQAVIFLPFAIYFSIRLVYNIRE